MRFKVNVCQTTNGISWPITTHRGINHQRLAPHGHAYSATVAADRFFVGMLDFGRSEDRWVKGRSRSSIVRLNRVFEQWGRKGPAHHPPKARRRAVLWPPERDESGGEGRSQTLHFDHGSQQLCNSITSIHRVVSSTHRLLAVKSKLHAVTRFFFQVRLVLVVDTDHVDGCEPICLGHERHLLPWEQ